MQYFAMTLNHIAYYPYKLIQYETVKEILSCLILIIICEQYRHFVSSRELGTEMYCVVPENIHTSPTEGISPNTSPPLWKFQPSSIHFFILFGLKEPPFPPGNSNPFCEGYGYFLELHNIPNTKDHFWPCFQTPRRELKI